jgi:SAM-dependent methyltransferase
MSSEPSYRNSNEFDFARRYRERVERAARPRRTAEDWDARARGSNRNAFDSPYLRALLERMDLRGCATLLDVGCGPGTVGLSVAARLEHVYGLDYSPGMLERFAENARSRGLNRVTPILLGWDDDWTDVPACDVVVASRSTAVPDLEAALLKLDAKARLRVYVTYPADGRFVPADVLHAIGRSGGDLPDYVFLVGILHDLGFYPTLDYLPGENRLARCGTFEEVHSKVTELIGTLTPDESTRLRRHYGAKEGRVGEEPVRWALVSWEKSTRSTPVPATTP